jgi:GntR family transcriptional repressor for pyruvate dehydrogenase complex
MLEAKGGPMSERETGGAAYEPVRTPRVFEEITAQLRRRVIHGHLKPGDRLPAERDLAAKLGVSRNTVREALRVLEMAGVLRLQKGATGGAFVASPKGEVVAIAFHDMFQLGSVTPAQLTEARLFIEESVIRLACERMDKDDLAELERNVEKSLRASKSGDYPLRSAINLEFHNILARATRNPMFVAIIGGLISVMQQFVNTIGPPRGNAVFESRRRFIAHLRARRADAAVAEMADFLRSVHKQYLSRVDGVRKPVRKAAKRGRSAK